MLEELTGVEFIVFDKKAGISGYRNLRRALSGRRFDILLHMQLALRASLATLCISAKEKWGFSRERSREGQTLFVNRQLPLHPERHVADGFMAFAKAIGVTKPS